MIYHKLFNKDQGPVSTAVVGTGHFGKAIVTQQAYSDFIEVRVVVDIDLESAKGAYIDSNIPEEEISFADNIEKARELYKKGKYIYTDQFDIVMELEEIDVVVEGTGVPEVGAKNAKTAIEHGKHVAMVSKEPDSAVGPILKHLAEQKGVIYTPVDGDQHGLLMSMYEWAKTVGLDVVSGGKARDGEFILDEEERSVTIHADGITVHETTSVTLEEEDLKYFKKIPEGKSKEYIEKRSELLESLPGAAAFDLCELTIMANTTDLSPETPHLYKAPLRITELPIAYASEENGGVFKEEETLDVITCLRRDDESGMGGGVFLVVKCDNAYSNYILTTKGQIPNYDRSTAVIYRPYHLCGVETSISIAAAGLLNIDTGATKYIPRFDLVKRAARDIKAGETFGNDHDYSMEAQILPAASMQDDNAIPGHLITGNKAKVDIKKGELITYSMIEKPENSVLWELRQLQDKTFSV